MLKYVTGNVVDQSFDTDEVTCIPHVVNDDGVMGSGLALALYKKWPLVKKMYNDWLVSDLSTDGACFKLGQVQFIYVEKNVVIANMIGQSSPGGDTIDGIYIRPIRLESLYECMLRVASYCNKKNIKNIMSGKFGSLRAGGDWDTEIVPLINKTWNNFDVTIFEYNELSK